MDAQEIKSLVCIGDTRLLWMYLKMKPFQHLLDKVQYFPTIAFD